MGILSQIFGTGNKSPGNSSIHNSTGIPTAEERNTVAVTPGDSSAYADPVAGFAPYHWAGYWAWRQQDNANPDMRTQNETVSEQGTRLDNYREPNPVRPQDFPPYHGDTQARWSETWQRGTPYDEPQIRIVQAPDPRWMPPESEREIRQISTYSFSRPYDVGLGEPELNGNHFSQAELLFPNKIGTMNPTGDAMGARNTYRISPPPGDAAITDRGNTTIQMNGGSSMPPVEYASSGSRNWRLGG